MSRTKAVRVGQRGLWAYDNPHDVVMAHLVELSDNFDVPDAVVADWRVWASVSDLAFTYKPTVSRDLLTEMLDQVRHRVLERGTIGKEGLQGWKVFEDLHVSDGFVRGDSIHVNRILDVLDAIRGLVDGTLPAPPEGTWWFVGAPGGRSTIGMASGVG